LSHASAADFDRDSILQINKNATAAAAAATTTTSATTITTDDRDDKHYRGMGGLTP